MISFVVDGTIMAHQGFGRENNKNRGGFKGSILVIFCCKEFEKSALCRYISQSKTAIIVYSEPIASGYVNKIFTIPDNIHLFPQAYSDMWESSPVRFR